MNDIRHDEWTTGDTGLPNIVSVGTCTFCKDLTLMYETEKKRHLSTIHANKKGILNGRQNTDVISC